MNPTQAFANRTARLLAEGAHKDRLAYTSETPFAHENTPYGAYGEFEPVPEDVDWAAHDAEADAFFAQYDDDPNPYHGDYSEM